MAIGFFCGFSVLVRCFRLFYILGFADGALKLVDNINTFAI